MLLTGCATSTGLGGCSESTDGEFQETATNTVSSGVFAALTQAGVNFLIEKRENLVGLLLSVDNDGWAQIEVPEISFGEDGLSATTKGLLLGIDLRNSDIDMTLSGSPLRINVQIRRAALRIEDGSIEIRSTNEFGICKLLNGEDVMTPSERVTTIDLGMVITPRLTADGRIDVDVSLLPTQLIIDRPSIGFTSDDDAAACRDGSCEFVCDTTNFLSELVNVIYEDFEESIGSTLAPILNERIDEELAELSQMELLLDGQFSASESSTAFPGDTLSVNYGFRPSSDGLEYLNSPSGAAIGLGVNIGIDSQNHPCVPTQSQDKVFLAGPQPTVDQIAPQNSQYHAALAISEATINRGLWSAWRSGMLCIMLDSEQLKSLTDTEVDTSTLGVFFASLGLLIDEPSPIMVSVDPQFLSDTFPVLSFREMPTDSTVPQVGLDLNLPNFGIDIYAFINGSWTRLLGVSTSIELAVQIKRIDTVKLGLAIDVPTIADVNVNYSEILMAEEIPKLLEVVVDLAIASLSDETLAVDFELDGLLESLLGLPYELVISDLVVAGAERDHLGIALRIEEIETTMALTASMITDGVIIDGGDDWVDIKLNESNTSNVGYEWRLQNGPWRPVKKSNHGVLRITEPRLLIDTDQQLEIRAVDLSSFRRAPGPPLILDVPSLSKRRTLAWPKEQIFGTGCSSMASHAVPHWVLALLLGLAYRRRRTYRSFSLIYLFFFVLYGCDDSPSSTDLPCQISQDCPAGRICVDNFCVLNRKCESDSECCGHQTCRDGQCEALATDGCTLSSVPCAAHETCIADTCVAQICNANTPCQSGATCIEGACVSGLLCDGQCESDQVCWLHRNTCRPKPTTCPQTCEASDVLVVVNARQFDDAKCPIEQLECACYELNAKGTRPVVRQFDMALLNGRLRTVSYEPQLGDLVYGNDWLLDPENTIVLDGFEQSSETISTLELDRNGQRLAGPDRGEFPQIATDSLGRLHTVYLDRSASELRYLRQEADGRWQTPIIFDEVTTNFGGMALRIDERDDLHLAYQFIDDDGQHQIRYAYAPPTATVAADFTEFNLDPTPRGPTTEVDSPIPKLLSQPCLTIVGETVVIGYRDSDRGTFLLSRGNLSGFQTDELLAMRNEFNDGVSLSFRNQAKVGHHCALTTLNDQVVGVVSDWNSWSLIGFAEDVTGRYGLSYADRPFVGQRQIVGGSPQMITTSLGQVIVVYQESTNNDLKLTWFDGQTWSATPRTLISLGAVGFSNRILEDGPRIIVGTVELATQVGNRESSMIRVTEFQATDL